MVRRADMLPQDYDQWLECLRAGCRCEVTPEFVASRIAVLDDLDRAETRAFVAAWGESHRQQVVAWFRTLRLTWLQ